MEEIQIKEIKQKLIEEISKLPEAEKFLQKGVSYAVNKLKNGAGKRIIEITGKEYFEKQMQKIDMLMPDYEELRKNIALKFYNEKVQKLSGLEEDILQNLSIKIMCAIDNYNPSKGAIENYLNKTIKFALKKERASRFKEDSMMSTQEVDIPFDDSLDTLMEKDIKEKLWEYVEYLSPEEKYIIKKRYRQGILRTELSRSMGVHAKKIKQIEERAIRKLREIIF